MPKQVLTDAENYTIERDTEAGCLVFTWDQFAAGEEFRAGCEELLDVIERESATKLVVDSSGIKAHDREDLQWLEEEWMPREIEAGIEYSVSVTGDSVISEMEIEEFVDQTEDMPFTYVMAGNLAEARDWIADQ